MALFVQCLLLATPASAASPVFAPVPEGFGQATTGGAGGTTYFVTNLNDAGPGSLRDGVENLLPRVVKFRISGQIQLQSHLMVGPDKTIDGRGADITITGRGFYLEQSNVIIRNLKMSGFHAPIVYPETEETEDGIHVDGASRVWLDHLDMSDAGDKLIGVEHGTDITISWSRFSNQHTVLQFGAYAGRELAADIRVTLHHNYFDSTGFRNPNAIYGKVHAYNNYLRNWQTYGMASIRNNQLLSEANIFGAGVNKRAVLFEIATDLDKDPTPGMVRSVGDLLQNGAVVRSNGPELVFSPISYYVHSPELADLTLKRRLTKSTGWQATGNLIPLAG